RQRVTPPGKSSSDDNTPPSQAPYRMPLMSLVGPRSSFDFSAASPPPQMVPRSPDKSAADKARQQQQQGSGLNPKVGEAKVKAPEPEPRAEPVVQAPAKQAAKPGMKDSAGRAPKKGPPLAVFGMGGGGGGGFADAGSSKPASLPSSRRQGGGGGGLVTSIVSKAFADDSDTDMSQSFDELPGPGGNLGQSDEFDF
ncbi:hypothetical protein CYMTET_24511, partial [Cymbomonas tetramitiformis]